MSAAASILLDAHEGHMPVIINSAATYRHIMGVFCIIAAKDDRARGCNTLFQQRISVHRLHFGRKEICVACPNGKEINGGRLFIKTKQLQQQTGEADLA